MSLTVSERFWAKADVGDPSECWEWRAAKDCIGYGRFMLEGKARKANRLALILSGSPEPFERACAMHSCDNRACVNPAHLRWGTQSENMTDCAKKARNKMAILTPADIREIRASSLKQYELAKIYGVQKQTISLICRGVTWRHVEDVI